MNSEHAARRAGDDAFLVPRRDFLILGSAAAVGAVASSAAGDWAQPMPAGDILPLSLGFVSGTFDALRLETQPRALADAGHLSSGHRLGAAARVRVHGIVRADGARGKSLVALDALYRVPALAQQEVAVLAWSDHDSARRGGSSAAGFVVPVSSSAPLTVAVTAHTPSTWRAALARRLFGTPAPAQDRRATAMLHHRGVYFIAVPAAGQPAPDWASIRAVAPTTGKLPLLMRSSLFGTSPVSFDYIVVGTEQA